MLMTEKTVTIRKATVQLDDWEMASLNDVNALVLCYTDVLEQNDATQMVNPATGELIEYDDLLRLRGVLGGLIHCREWVLE